MKITEKTKCREVEHLLTKEKLEELMKLPGIGRVKAVQLKCIGELSRRIAGSAARQSIILSEPGTIADYYMERLRHEAAAVYIAII